MAVPVSSDSTRLVTLTGAKLGQIVAGNQQRYIIAGNRSLQQQQQLQKEKRPQLQKPKQQISKSMGQETVVTATSNEGNQLPAQQDLGNYLTEYMLKCLCGIPLPVHILMQIYEVAVILQHKIKSPLSWHDYSHVSAF